MSVITYSAADPPTRPAADAAVAELLAGRLPSGPLPPAAEAWASCCDPPAMLRAAVAVGVEPRTVLRALAALLRPAAAALLLSPGGRCPDVLRIAESFDDSPAAAATATLASRKAFAQTAAADLAAAVAACGAGDAAEFPAAVARAARSVDTARRFAGLVATRDGGDATGAGLVQAAIPTFAVLAGDAGDVLREAA